MRCPNCKTKMELVLSQVRGNPITGKPVREELWHCPHCYFVWHRAVPVDKPEPPKKLSVLERLKRLGYL